MFSNKLFNMVTVMEGRLRLFGPLFLFLYTLSVKICANIFNTHTHIAHSHFSIPHGFATRKRMSGININFRFQLMIYVRFALT